MTGKNYYCPRCGANALTSSNNHKYGCGNCGFELYNNVAATVSIVLCHGKEILFSQRAREPSKGLLDFPGGFVDPGESLEEALKRELSEELGWQADKFRYLFSFSNTYPYGGVVYRTADTFFLCKVDEKPQISAQDDVEALVWSSLDALKPEQLAFGSVTQTVAMLSQMSY